MDYIYVQCNADAADQQSFSCLFRIRTHKYKLNIHSWACMYVCVLIVNMNRILYVNMNKSCCCCCLVHSMISQCMHSVKRLLKIFRDWKKTTQTATHNRIKHTSSLYLGSISASKNKLFLPWNDYKKELAKPHAQNPSCTTHSTYICDLLAIF